jgi:hypothetical protein
VNITAKMAGICLAGLIVLFYILTIAEAAEADVQQMAKDAGAIGTIIEQAESAIIIIFRVLSEYGFKLAAFLGAPYLSWRFWQKIKIDHKAKKGKKPHYLVMDVGNVLVAAGLCALFYSFHEYFNAKTYADILPVSITVGMFSWLIVKIIFKFAPTKVVEILHDGMYDPNMTIIGAFAGRREDTRSVPRADDEPDKPRR